MAKFVSTCVTLALALAVVAANGECAVVKTKKRILCLRRENCISHRDRGIRLIGIQRIINCRQIFTHGIFSSFSRDYNNENISIDYVDFYVISAFRTSLNIYLYTYVFVCLWVDYTHCATCITETRAVPRSCLQTYKIFESSRPTGFPKCQLRNNALVKPPLVR